MTFMHLAYVDPGSASIVLQAVIGGALGIAYVCRNFIRRGLTAIKSIFTPRTNSSDIKD